MLLRNVCTETIVRGLAGIRLIFTRSQEGTLGLR